MMLLVVLLILLAILTGVLAFVIKAALWLLILTVLFLVGAFFVHRGSRV